MKFLIVLVLMVSCLWFASEASVLQAHSCEGGIIYNQKIISALLYQDREGRPYLTMNVRATRPYNVRISSMAEGLMLLGLIKSDADANLRLLLVGDGIIAKSGGECVFSNEYRVSYALTRTPEDL